MGKWTRRDLVKASLAASAAIASGDLLAEASGNSKHLAAYAEPTGSRQSVAFDSSALRERLLLDFGWRFALGNANDPDKDFGFASRLGTFAKAGFGGGPADARFDDSSWRKLDLPHDWAVELPFVNDKKLVDHGSKPVARQYPESSIGWYRREFLLPGTDVGKRISVEFDGIFRNAMIFVNGNYLTQNMSGYAPVALDITDFVNFATDKPELGRPSGPRVSRTPEAPGRNVISVRVDATLDEGWFYEGAGIYRHVWLTKTAPVHFIRWGTAVRTDFAKKTGVITSADPANVSITSEVANQSERSVSGRVRVELVDEAGKTAGTMTSLPARIAAGDTHEFSMQTVVARPKLWSCEEPNLYRATTVFEVGGEPVDREEHTFGVRTIRFDVDRGFFLNGRHVKIKGTCNHQDHAGVGAALPDRLQSYRLERLKWMGSNGCRTSHNPPTPEFLDACDRMGMVVMDETRMMSSGAEGLSQLERLIRRDRNHPSIILWSLANEEPQEGNTRGARIVASMRNLQRRLDPTRLCTAAMNAGYGGDGVSTVIDVQGFNYREHLIDQYHKDHPNQPIIGTETASSIMTRGIYANNEETGHISSYGTEAPPSYAMTAEQWWNFYADREFLAGGFAWTGFDYRGEPKPYGWPCISSHFGILDTCGFAKDPAYYYKTWWGSEPTLHVLPHWNWQGREGQEVLVVAYSNQDSVELFLNGQSQGSQPVKKNGHVEWKVKYAPGVLEARASKDGRVVLTEKRETVGPAAKIVVTPDRRVIDADGQDVAVVNVSIVDADGRPHPTADNKVSFAIEGPGAIIGVGNGDESCHEPDKPVNPTSAERSAFNGLCMAIVQTRRGQPGSISVRVSCHGLETAIIAIGAKEAPLPQIVT